jgi:carboxylesterase
MLPVPAVLCLHGFTGTPFEVEALASSLRSRGYSVSAPMLPGHGGGIETLAAVGADDWLTAADREFARLADETDGRVAIVGASMGALLALRLARRRPELIAALVLMAAPLRWRPIERRGVEVLGHMARLFGVAAATIPKTGGVDAVDPIVRRTAPSLDAYPIAALHHLIALTDAAADDVPSVTAPSLVVHGRQDRTVPLDVSEHLAASLGSTVVERLWLDDSGHLVAADTDRRMVATAVSDFLARHAQWAQGSAAHTADQPLRA